MNMKTIKTIFVLFTFLFSQIAFSADDFYSGCQKYHEQSVPINQQVLDNYSVLKEASVFYDIYSPKAYEEMDCKNACMLGSLIWVWGWSIVIPAVPVGLGILGIAMSTQLERKLADDLFVSKVSSSLLSKDFDKQLFGLKEIYREVKLSEIMNPITHEDLEREVTPYRSKKEKSDFIEKMKPVLAEINEDPNSLCEVNSQEVVLSAKGQKIVDKFGGGSFYV